MKQQKHEKHPGDFTLSHERHALRLECDSLKTEIDLTGQETLVKEHRGDVRWRGGEIERDENGNGSENGIACAHREGKT